MEKSRLLLLVETLKSAVSNEFGLPKDLIQKNRNLQDNLASLQERYLEATTRQDSALQLDLQSGYSLTWDNMTRVQNEIKINYPKYFELRDQIVYTLFDPHKWVPYPVDRLDPGGI